MLTDHFILSSFLSNNYKNLFCDFIFLHLAAENSARWQYRLARGMFFLMAILDGWGLDHLPLEGDLNLQPPLNALL
jgi:hypothetical protein